MVRMPAMTFWIELRIKEHQMTKEDNLLLEGNKLMMVFKNNEKI